MFFKNFHFYSGLTNILFSVMLFFFMMGCSLETPSQSDVDIVELTDYKTLVPYENNILVTPSIIRYDGDSTLFVYDDAQTKVLELDSSGLIVNEYGRAGRGPGELLLVNNIFLTDTYLYIVDNIQYFIHKYNRHGSFVSSMDYGNNLGLPNAPPTPFNSSIIQAKDINNQPFVTLDGNVMLSSVPFSDSVQTIYKLIDWDGNHISDIGEVPEGSSFVIDNEKLRTDVSNRVIPSIYRSNVFAVNDHTHSSEYFLVYTALAKIVKYNDAGQKLWENDIAQTSEIDSLTIHFYEAMERMLQADPNNRIVLNYYTAGVSNADGDLFLVTDSNPIWIHQFNATGELIRRYKLISEDVDIMPIFDIDFTGSHIIVVTEEAEIRAYSFKM